MKSKRILSLLTAAAIVATVGISYAAWDSTSVTADSNITIAEQMKVEMTGLSFAADQLAPEGSFAAQNGAVSTASSGFTVTVPDSFKGVTDIQLSVTSVKDGVTEVADYANIFNFTFKKGDASTGTELTGGKDTTVTTASNAYTVIVSFKDASTLTDEQIAAITGKELTFTVSAQAIAKTA